VTGDTRQSDLDKLNGLEDFINKIQSLELDYVEYTNLGEEDVVRHPAVSEILSLYYN
jgi:phosphate starvation-inducible PhoH-like protein